MSEEVAESKEGRSKGRNSPKKLVKNKGKFICGVNQMQANIISRRESKKKQHTKRTAVRTQLCSF